MNIGEASEFLQTVIEDIHRDYPEFLLDDSEEVSTAESGVHRRIVQQPATAKILTRRAGKDAVLVAAHNMAMSIGAMREYKGFEKLSETGFADGQFEHTIGKRDVFASDAFEELQESKLFYEVIAAAKLAGIPPESALARLGLKDDEIADIMKLTRSDNRRVATVDARAQARAAREAQQADAVEVIDVGTEGQEPEAGQ